MVYACPEKGEILVRYQGIPLNLLVMNWTAEDIRGGLYVIKDKYNPEKSTLGYGATVTAQIGYVLNANTKSQYSLNSISDGWVYDNLNKLFTKERLAEVLNEGGYRLATLEELTSFLSHLKKNFTI